MPGPDPLTTEWVPIWNTTGPLYTVEDEGVGLPVRTILNFTGPGVIASDVGGKTTITITGTPQTPWLSPIDAAGFPLSGIPDITFHYAGVKAGMIGSFIFEGNGALEFYTYDATDGHLAIHAAVGGHVGIAGPASTTHNLEVTGTLNLMGGPYYLNGVPLALGQPQTPWLSNINGGGFLLSNVSRLYVQRGVDDVDTLIVSGADNSKYMAFQSNAGTSRILHWNGTGWGNITICQFGGSVGIGAPPAARLTVEAATDHVLNVRGDPTSFGLPAGRLGPILQAVNSAQNLHTPLTTYASETAILGGLVGINMVPAHALDVNGNCNITGQYLVNGVPISTGGAAQTPWTSSHDAAGYALYGVHNLSLGAPQTARPGVRILALGMSNSGAADAKQIACGEAGNNPDYQLQLGYSVIAGAWSGAIQSIGGAAGNALYINPLGGSIAVGHAANPAAKISLGSINPPYYVNRIAVYEAADGSNTYGIGMSQAGGASVAIWTGVLPSDSNPHSIFTYTGNFGVGTGSAGPGCRISTGSDLATCKIASYELSNGFFGIGVQAGVLTFAAGITGLNGAATMNLSSTGKLAIGNGNTASPACTIHIASGGIYSASGLFIEPGDMTSLINGGPWYGYGRQNTTGYTQVAGYNGVILQTGSFASIQTSNRVSLVPGAAVNTFALASQQLRICEPSNNGNYGMTLGYGIPSARYGGMIQAWDNGAPGTLYLNPSGGNIVMANSASWGADTANMPLGTIMIYYNHTNSYLYFYIKRTDTQVIRTVGFLAQ